MKSYVTPEELNAALMLITGAAIGELVEVHIAGSTVTAVTMRDGGDLSVARLPVGTVVTETEAAEESDS